ncbi:hypothetical protein K3495_g3029 [Podosphaera aphanis]|nr:hypothetical protein K3495_g3029 [Podosphaera aphanis]
MSGQGNSETKRPKTWNGTSRYFNNPKYSDVTIKILDEVLYAHQLVICDQSEYFEKALQKGSQQFSEADTNIIEFKEGSGPAYWRVFEYLYTGDYSDFLSSSKWTDDPHLLKDVRVYALADMFLIESLKTLAQTRLAKKLECCHLDTPFIDCVREVYKTIPTMNTKMHSAVVEVAVKQVKILRKNFDDKSASDQQRMSNFGELIREGGDFTEHYFLGTINLIRTA